MYVNVLKKGCSQYPMPIFFHCLGLTNIRRPIKYEHSKITTSVFSAIEWQKKAAYQVMSATGSLHACPYKTSYVATLAFGLILYLQKET